MNDEEYWDEYGSYDSAAAELKETLIGSVKKEIAEKIAKLEQENAELKGKQKNLNVLEAKAKQKAAQLDREIAGAERSVRYKKAKDLFREIAETKYITIYEHYMPDKCAKCDDKRQLPFIYPSGKEGYENCPDCGSTRTKYVVTEAIGTSVDIRDGDLMIWYKPYRSWEDEEYHSMSGDIKTPYKGQDFADLNQYRTLFNDKDTAQKYADYLTEKKQS